MDILTAQQLKKTDEITIIKQNISSWQLMERAANTLFEAIKLDYDIFTHHFTIICGLGNNGGDGLALARLLFQSGSEVKIYLISAEQYSEDNILNQQKVQKLTSIQYFNFKTKLELLPETIIVDALFGFGLNRPLNDEWNAIINQINASKRRVISIDMPSGLLADEHNAKGSPIVKADIIYTFHAPKTAFLLPENKSYNECFKILDIHLEKLDECFATYLGKEDIKKLIKPTSRFSHKGTFGHSLIWGGSYGKIGATILSAKAALRTGCGLVTVQIPKCGYEIIQSTITEAMVITDANQDHITELPNSPKIYSSIGLGIGMGTNQDTLQALKLFLQQNNNLPPLVLDADALNLMAMDNSLLDLLPKYSILTPHPKELQRLIGNWNDDYEKLNLIKEFSHKHTLILVLKGANSIIQLPHGKTYFNSTGNIGMATAGSGDVLTGILTSLLAQGHSPTTAAIIGVFLHGYAADLAIKHIHPKSLIASDIIKHISSAWSCITSL